MNRQDYCIVSNVPFDYHTTENLAKQYLNNSNGWAKPVGIKFYSRWYRLILEQWGYFIFHTIDPNKNMKVLKTL
jgi:hypothetical protein